MKMEGHLGKSLLQVPDTGMQVSFNIGRYWYIICVPVSVDTGTFSVYQRRSILVHFPCTRGGQYWYISAAFCAPVSVDTRTFSVYQYRSILERFLCISISRYWNVSVYHYRSIRVHFSCTRMRYQYRSILERLSYYQKKCKWCISSPILIIIKSRRD